MIIKPSQGMTQCALQIFIHHSLKLPLAFTVSPEISLSKSPPLTSCINYSRIITAGPTPSERLKIKLRSSTASVITARGRGTMAMRDGGYCPP